MENFKKGYLSIGQKKNFSKGDYPITLQERKRMSRIPYALTVGSIIYAMTCMRLDVAYSLRIVSRYQFDSDENHWKVVKIIFNYLRSTKDQWLIYGDTDLKLMRYTDFNFQSDHDDNRSILDYVFILNGGVIC